MAQAFAETLVDCFERDGALLPMLPRGVNQAEVGARQRGLLEFVTTAIRPFERDLAQAEPNDTVRFLVQFVLASVTREACGPTHIGWRVVRRELPRVARAYVEPPARPQGGAPVAE